MRRIIRSIYLHAFAAIVSLVFVFPVFSQDRAASETITSSNSQALVEIATLGQGIISQVLWSSDGRMLAVSTSRGIWLFDAQEPFVLATNTTPRLLTGEGKIAFSPDSQYLVSGLSQQAILWNAASGEAAAQIPINSQIHGFSFSDDSTLLAVTPGNCEGSCIFPIWQIRAEPRLLLEIQVEVSFVMQSAFSPDNTLLAAVDMNGFAHLWTLPTGEEIATFDSDIPAWRGATLAFNHDGSRLLVHIMDNYANSVPHDQFYLWDVASDERLLFIDAERVTIEPVFNTSRTIAALHTGYDFIALIDLQNGQEIGRIRSSAAPTYLTFSSDNAQLVAQDEHENYWIWDVQQALDYGVERVTLPTEIVPSIEQLYRTVPDLAFPPHLGSTSPELAGHQQPVSGLYFSEDNLQVISHSADSTTRIWSLGEQRQIAVFEQASGFGGINAFMPENILANTSWDSDIQLWDLTNGELRTSLEAHEGRINTLAFSPNGRFLASGSEPFGYYGEETLDASLRLWNLETQQAVILEQGDFNVKTAVFSPNGERLVSGGDAADRHNLIFWDVNTTHRIAAVGDYDSVSSWHSAQMANYWLWDRISHKSICGLSTAKCQNGCKSYQRKMMPPLVRLSFLQMEPC